LNVTINLDPIIIGLYAGVTFIPYTLKIFIGPLMDKVKIPIIGGRIKPYIIIGALLNALFLIPLGLDPTNFLIIYFLCWVLQNLGFVFLDVAIDILIIKDKQNRHPTTSSIITVLGVTLGEIFIGLFSFVFDISNFLGFLLVGLISLSIILVTFIFKEKQHELYTEKSSLKELFSSLKNRNIILGVIFGFFIMFDTGLREFTLE
jgi:hypothetical protein